MAAFTFGPFYPLRRSKLRDLLSQNLDIQYEKGLNSIDYALDGESVTAHFADASTATGSILIGADGARSSTRQLLLGTGIGAINQIPYAATFVQWGFTTEQALYVRSFYPLFIASAHPGNKFAFFGMHDAANPVDRTSWTFFFYISWKISLEEQHAIKDWNDAQRLAQQKELAKDFCNTWNSAFEWTPDDAPVWYMGLTDCDPGREGCRWDHHSGLVTTVGDAVHPMTNQRGQGLNHSVQTVTDAGKLRDALLNVQNGTKRREVIIEFEDEVVKRG